MASRFLPSRDEFCKAKVGRWTLVREAGRGKNGVVYEADDEIAPGVIDKAALKLIPEENLKIGWESEIHKAVLLDGIDQIVPYKGHFHVILKGRSFAAVAWKYEKGNSLRQFVEDYHLHITISFIESILEQLLRLALALDTLGLSHGDLHEGNIIIAEPDHRRYELSPLTKITDFGIGASINGIEPKDDYLQIARICYNLLDRIDPSTLSSTPDKIRRRYLVQEFLPKQLLERDPTVGTFVRKPRTLLELLTESRTSQEPTQPSLMLDNPWDYLSCEQIGDSFELLQMLYSNGFPGYDDLLQKSNTILTGPRGCGKTMIFRNLSLKTQLLAGQTKIFDPGDFIGIYYHCSDIYFPFQYFRNPTSELDRRVLLHYFNLALLGELLDTLVIAQREPAGVLDPECIRTLQKFLQSWLHSYSFPPKGTPVLPHLLSVVGAEKHRVTTWLQKRKRDDTLPDPMLPTAFIAELCKLLSELIPWINRRPFYIFLDDYSLPHISERMQETLHDCVLFRWPKCFFKISTESITTLHPFDSSGKLLEDTREYNIVDFGAYFFAAPDRRKEFLATVINNRLQKTRAIHPSYHSIQDVLGGKPWATYNDLARQLRKKEKVFYAGFDTLADLFSGDIAHMLHLVRGIFGATAPLESFYEPGCTVSAEQQNYAIRDYAGTFLSRVACAPRNGAQLAKFAEHFGTAANWLLRNRDSKNENTSPPWQAFRIVVRNSFTFDNIDIFRGAYEATVPKAKQKTYGLEQFAIDCKKTYDDLLKYGVFLRDDRGKTMRGAVVPRLYLRRLLLPKFGLTPSQRDSVYLDVEDFIFVLARPQFFQSVITKGNVTQEIQERLIFK